MPIPLFTPAGILPAGVHECSFDELRARFGAFQSSDARPRLVQKLEAYFRELRASGLAEAIIINGSFVTKKESPNDIDILVVLPSGHDFRADLSIAQYRVVDSRRVRRDFGLDIFIVEDVSDDFMAMIQFFQRVRLQPAQAKGILRIRL